MRIYGYGEAHLNDVGQDVAGGIGGDDGLELFVRQKIRNLWFRIFEIVFRV